jgi:hypothetical protein
MSADRDLTPWFPGTVKPARPGVYERTDHDEMWDFARWDGRRWMCGQLTPEEADTLVMHESMYQPHHGDTGFSWRGRRRAAASMADPIQSQGAEP